MTFAELLTEVYSITSRDDLVEMTKSAIKSATLKAHRTDFYSKDLYEDTYEFPSGLAYVHSFDVFSVIPNYRALKYLRLIDPTTLENSTFISVITPEEILDKWQRTRTNVCYVAGRIIEINASIEFDKIALGCYVNPVIVEASYSSWIADTQPWAIINEAARQVFLQINQEAEAKGQRSLVSEEYAELKINAVTDVGY